MKKSDRIQELLEQLATGPAAGLDPRYTGWFACFNAQRYYDAHDVLEDLWLSERGADHAFYKGLIQLAGAFVHLQKQHIRPDHPKDGRRLAPASRLFSLAIGNLAAYRPMHQGLDVERTLALAQRFADALAESSFTTNPWHPDAAPTIELT